MTRHFLFRHSAVSILFGLAAAIVLCFAAFAADTAASAPSTTVDLSPLLSEVLWPLLGTIATALAGWVAQRAATWFHLQNQDVVRGYVLQALQTALDVAYARLGGAPMTIETHSQTVASIATYLITVVPKGLKALGFTLRADDPKLLALISARLTAADWAVSAPVPPTAAG